MCASPGPGGGRNVLKTAVESAPFFGADIKSHFSVGPFNEKFDRATGELLSSDLATQLREGLLMLQAEYG